MFVQKELPFEHIKNVRFLWSFDCVEEKESFYRESITEVLSLLKIDPIVLSHMQKSKHETNVWEGCFGVCSVITHEFLSVIENTFRVFETLIPVVDCRYKRCVLERVFAILCFVILREQLQHSLLGNISEYTAWGTSYDDFMMNKEAFMHLPIVKVWVGR